MSPLGCLRDARAAVEGRLAMVGGGGFRDVFSDKRGRYVYKVCKYDDEWEYNTREHEKAIGARESGVPGIPRTHLWVVDGKPVLCMRRYPQPSDATASRLSEDIVHIWERAGFVDLHGYNYTLTKGGRPRLLDMAGY